MRLRVGFWSRWVVMRTDRGAVLVLAKGCLPLPGGIERYSSEICVAYADLGFRVFVVSRAGDQRPRVFRKDGCVFINLGSEEFQPAVLLKAYFAIRRLRAKPFDVVHATTWRMLLAQPSLMSTTKSIVSIHGREVFVVPTILRPLMRWVLSSTSLLAFVSRPIEEIAVRENAWLVGCEREVALNGISFADAAADFKRPQSSSRPTLLTVCRLVVRKNIAGALRAYKMALDQGAELGIYEIIGAGPEEASLKALADELKISEFVRFRGYVSDADMLKAYMNAEIFLHPQHGSSGDIEGFGLTIADAMSFGCAVIAGKQGGPSSFIQDQITGLLVDGSSDDQICSALFQVALPSTRREMGERGREWALTHLRWRHVVERVLRRVGIHV